MQLGSATCLLKHTQRSTFLRYRRTSIQEKCLAVLILTLQIECLAIGFSLIKRNKIK